MGPPGVLAALELLQGEDFPVRAWESVLMAPRVDGYEREWLDRLGLSPPEGFNFEPRMKRQSDRVNDDWVNRYSELRLGRDFDLSPVRE